MKVEVTNQEKKFEPIELKITIESEKELCDLWYRLDISTNNVEKIQGDYFIYKPTECRNNILYNKIDKLIGDKYPYLLK